MSPKTLSTAFKHCLGLSDYSRGSTPKVDRSPSRPAREICQRSNGAPEIQATDSKSEDLGEIAVDGHESDNKQESSDNRETQAKSLAGRILLVEDNQVNLKV